MSGERKKIAISLGTLFWVWLFYMMILAASYFVGVSS